MEFRVRGRLLVASACFAVVTLVVVVSFQSMKEAAARAKKRDRTEAAVLAFQVMGIYLSATEGSWPEDWDEVLQLSIPLMSIESELTWPEDSELVKEHVEIQRDVRLDELAHAAETATGLTVRGDVYEADPTYLLWRSELRLAIETEGGNAEQAMVKLNDKIRREPRKAWWYWRRARVHALQGNYDKCLKDRSIAERLDPTFRLYPGAANPIIPRSTNRPP